MRKRFSKAQLLHFTANLEVELSSLVGALGRVRAISFLRTVAYSASLKELSRVAAVPKLPNW